MDSHDDITQTANVVDVVGGSNVKGQSACFNFQVQNAKVCQEYPDAHTHIVRTGVPEKYMFVCIYIWTYMQWRAQEFKVGYSKYKGMSKKLHPKV
jgi:hypothetical protein